MTAEECVEICKLSGPSVLLRKNGCKSRVRIPMSNSFLDQSVTELDLSTRAWNCLGRAGIFTIRELVECIRKRVKLGDSRQGCGLDVVHGMGKITANEIKQSLLDAAYHELTEKEKNTFWEFVLNYDNSAEKP